MNGKWGVPNENPENVVSSFKRLWSNLRAYFSTQAIMNYADNGQIHPSKIDFNYPQPQIQSLIKRDFFELITVITKYLVDTEDYAFMEEYCRDMDGLFAWDTKASAIWKGTLLYAIDKQERYEEAYHLFQNYPRRKEIAAMYAQSLLDRVDLEKAEEVLNPFKDTSDIDVQARITMLERLKTVKGISSPAIQ